MAGNLYSNCIGIRKVKKTIREELKPVGKTLENIHKKGLLLEDEKRAENYAKVKSYIDEYHKAYIDRALSSLSLVNLGDYYSLYSKSARTEKERDELKKVEAKLRKEIAKALTSSEGYSRLFKKELIKEDLVEFLKDSEDSEEKISSIRIFENFTTYLKGFHENRKNMYSDEEKTTAIAYRVVNQNLPKFIDNMNEYEKVKKSPLYERLEDIKAATSSYLEGEPFEELFLLDYFNNVVTQTGIEKYNYAIGEVNKFINEYNQNADKDKRIGKLKVLYKQILSDRVKLSFVPDKYTSDKDVIESLSEAMAAIEPSVQKIQKLLGNLEEQNYAQIYIKNGKTISDISNKVFGRWNAINDFLEEDYDKKNLKGKRITKTYIDKRTKSIKKADSFSIEYLIEITDERDEILNYFINTEYLFDSLEQAKETFFSATAQYDYQNKKLMKDEGTITVIKGMLDAALEIVRFAKPLLGSGTEAEKDGVFYGEFTEAFLELEKITKVYDKVRNYVTQKPYSVEKIKLNFENPQLLGGWHLNKETDYCSIILRNGKYFYLGIMDKSHLKDFKDYQLPESSEDAIEKMKLLQIPKPARNILNLMVIDGKTQRRTGRKEKSGPHDGENLRLENYKNTYLPADINAIRTNKSYSKQSENFDREDLRKFIAYYQERVLEYDNFKDYIFDLKAPEEYGDFKEFADHINQQAYQINFTPISRKGIDKLVEEGKLYLFQIYNKDFSPYSKGTPNLHTLYWKMIFDQRNLKDVVYKFDSGAEMFFRKKSLDENDTVTHKANEELTNKNDLNPKKTSVFDYDIIKDKRFTQDKFFLHVPIEMNFKLQEKCNINTHIRECIKYGENPYVIGVDRGERHLLYLVVVNPDGDIVEQFSLNEIMTEYKGICRKTDYHKLLDDKESERQEARKNWKTIENIKDLKEGYLSQIIHIICNLMVKYNAIIVLEDLNSGFKRSRQKVEKQVYQKFEKMLIDKLNYLVDKHKDPEAEGGLLKAYQLTNEFESFAKLKNQSGVLFYIPAWMTSKMDPTTGFVSLFAGKDLRYSSVDNSRHFWSKFRNISYNAKDDYFEFNFDYNEFTTRAEGSRTAWTVCSFGERIYNFRNTEKNSQWDSERIDLTARLKELFNNFDVDYQNDDLLKRICGIEDKQFHQELLWLFKLILQMRNSITGTKVDYLISPVKNKDGEFFCSDRADDTLPKDADANGAYNIARKGLMLIDRINDTPDDKLRNMKLGISNKEWLNYAQRNC